MGLLLFGLAMTRFAKRNQRGLVFSFSVAMTALLAAAWVNSRVSLTALMLGALREMPLWGSAPAIATASAGLGALTALAVSFTQIKLNRYLALDAGYGRFTFVPHISEAMVRLRCRLGEALYWMVEAGMLFGLTRCPHSFRPELPQAFVQPPLRLIVRGAFNAEVLFSAVAVAGAGGVVAALFLLRLRKRDSRISAAVNALQMIAYLAMIALGSVSGALQLAVAYATSQGLSARFARMGYCRPEDCAPRFWFPLEERRCLLCGFMEAGAIRSQRRTVVSRAEIRALKCVHLLRAQNDDLFLRSEMSRDALWHMRFCEGDALVVCARCRKVFFAEDFTDSCPLCASDDKLWFSHPAALLMRRKTTLPSGATLELPYETAVLRCEEDRQPDDSSFAEHSAWLLMPAAMYVAVLLTCG